MQDNKWHDKQDKFSETIRQILGCCFEVEWTYHPGHHATCDHVDPVPL
jgi:hypothetical protein